MAHTYQAILSILDRASGPMLKIEENYRKMGEVAKIANKNMAPHVKLFTNLQRDLGEIGEKFKSVGEAASEMGRRFSDVLAPLGGLAAAGSIAGLVEMTHSFAESAEQLGIAAKISGSTVQQFQVLAYAGKQAGVPMDAMQRSLGMLNKNLGMAAAGKNKDLVTLFRQLHITMKDSHGAMLSAAQDLPNLMNAFKSMKNPTEEAAIAQKLFGRAGLEMIPFLEKGSAGLKEYTDQFSRYGYVLSNADVAGGEKFNETWKNMQTAVTGFTDELGAKLAPILTPLIQQFTDWTVKNRDWISTNIAAAVKSMGDAIKAIDFKKIVDDMKGFGETAKDISDKIGGFKTVLIVAGGVMTANFMAPVIATTKAMGALAVSMGAPIAKAVLGLGVSFVKVLPMMTSFRNTMIGLNLVMDANPFGATVVAVTALAGLGLVLFDNWKPIKGFFGDIGNDLDKVNAKIDNFQNSLGLGPNPGAKGGMLGGGRLAADSSLSQNFSHHHTFAGLPPGFSVTTKTTSAPSQRRTPNLGRSSMAGHS
jgi:TP901 family phage tail tape measure protein